MSLTFHEKTKIIVRKNNEAVGSITKRGKHYRFKAHQGIDCPHISSENLDDLKIALKEKL